MVQSMTGYGRSEGELLGGRIVVEARSVNHRYLETRIKLPSELAALEQRVVELIKEYLSRGRVEIYIAWAAGEQPVNLSWNRALAESYLEIIREMCRELDLPGEPDLSLLLENKGVIINEKTAALSEDDWPGVRAVFDDCLADLKQMREREGAVLIVDFKSRIQLVAELVEQIQALAPQVVETYREKLRLRIEKLLDSGGELDEQRLLTEVCIFADRCDISEELTRLTSHVDQFNKLLEVDGPLGRKLDFLLQELNREINTVGSKSQSTGISHLVVEVKNELERIREQVQNLE